MQYEKKSKDYMLPFDIDFIKLHHSFPSFKKSDSQVSFVVQMLNNPIHIWNIIINDPTIAKTYYYFEIKNNKVINHNLIGTFKKDIDDTKIKFIFVRLNIYTGSDMNHCNCAIIDKENHRLIFIEPKGRFTLKPKSIAEYMGLQLYDYIVLNYKIQYLDNFCQTYVLFSFLLISTNRDLFKYYTDTEEITYNYEKMIGYCVTNKNIGYFLFHIKHILDLHDIKSYNLQKYWSYPTNIITNLIKKVLYVPSIIDEDCDSEDILVPFDF